MAANQKRFFEGKRVIIVGPAGCLLSDCKKIDVDSFDVVCRLNGHYKMCRQHKNIIGKRTDIVFHALEPFQISKQDILHLNKTNIALFARDGNPQKKSRLKRLGYKKTLYNIPSTVLGKYRKELGCNPSTGILGIFCALHYGATEVHAIGFDFYQTLYQTKKDEKLRQEIIKNRVGNHNPKKQLQSFKRVIRNCKRFFPHGKLKGLLK